MADYALDIGGLGSAARTDVLPTSCPPFTSGAYVGGSAMDKEMLRQHRRPGYAAEEWSRSESIFETKDVQHRVDVACRALGDQMATLLFEHLERCAKLWRPFESPIELIFLAWWEAFETSWIHVNWGQVSGPSLQLVRQHEVEIDGNKFRLDFRVAARVSEHQRPHRGLFPNIAIELDGHDFHEKTKDQVTRRNWRDRLLQQHGWRVFHVSGSELARHPLDVTREIHQHCREEYERFEFKVYQASKNNEGSDATDSFD